MVIEFRAGRGTIFSAGSTGLTLDNISVYASGFIGVSVFRGSATTVTRVRVIPPPNSDRLISTNADGIHLAKAGANNIVTNNVVKRTCDDAIAIDGQWYAIVSAASNGSTVQVKRNNSGLLTVGESVDFINVVDGSIAGTASIVAESPDVSAQTGLPDEAITLTLDHAVSGLQANFGVTPHDPNLRGSGALISQNWIAEIVFGRGIYPAGVANVTISTNFTEKTNRAGILLSQDEGLIYNYKTGPSSGITIASNIVDRALDYGVQSSNIVVDDAAIHVFVYDQHFAWVTTQSLTNISILNNIVTNSRHTGIRMENVNGGTISGNLILHTGTDPTANIWYLPTCAVCESLAQIESDLAKPLVVTNSTNVTTGTNLTAP